MSELDAKGKPIRAKTVSVGFKGPRANIVQKPVTPDHVSTPVFVKHIYGKNGRVTGRRGDT